MAEGKFRISEEQKQQLVQAIVTLITVLVSIGMTLATQAVTDWLDGPGEPVEPDAMAGHVPGEVTWDGEVGLLFAGAVPGMEVIGAACG